MKGIRVSRPLARACVLLSVGAMISACGADPSQPASPENFAGSTDAEAETRAPESSAEAEDSRPLEWRQMSLPSELEEVELRAVWGTSSTDVYAVGQGTVLRFDGSSWTAMTCGTEVRLSSIWGATSDNVFAVGSNGVVASFDGASWTVETSASPFNLSEVWGYDLSHIFAVGSRPGPLAGRVRRNRRVAHIPLGDRIFQFDGSSWSSQESATSAALLGVWGSGPRDVFAVGLRGTVVHYDGQRWSPQQSGTDRDLNSIWGSSENDVIAVGDRVVVRYDGSAWSAEPIDAALLDIWGSGPGHIYTVGYEGKVLRHDGTAWRAVQVPSTESLHSVWGTGPEDIFIVGAQGTILRYGH